MQRGKTVCITLRFLLRLEETGSDASSFYRVHPLHLPETAIKVIRAAD
jgi:hypothetical protein